MSAELLRGGGVPQPHSRLGGTPGAVSVDPGPSQSTERSLRGLRRALFTGKRGPISLTQYPFLFACYKCVPGGMEKRARLAC